MVDVQASERSRILFMDVNRILTTCSSSCDFHNRLIRSLMYVLAGKNLMLTKKIGYHHPQVPAGKGHGVPVSGIRKAGQPYHHSAL